MAVARRKTAKVAVWSDPHCPFHNERSLDLLMHTLDEYAHDLTHIVCLGDLFEADAASKFENEHDHDLLDEYEAAARLLDRVRRYVPDTIDCVWTLGNHDDNVQAEARLDKRVRRAAHWNHSEWAESFRAWRQIPYTFDESGCLQLGQVIFKHGFGTDDDNEAVQWMNVCGGHGNRLVVGGHTHRRRGLTQVMKTKRIPFPLYSLNTGTMGPTKPPYMQRKFSHEWGAAVGVIELQLGRACQPGINWSVEYRAA